MIFIQLLTIHLWPLMTSHPPWYDIESRLDNQPDDSSITWLYHMIAVPRLGAIFKLALEQWALKFERWLDCRVHAYRSKKKVVNLTACTQKFGNVWFKSQNLATFCVGDWLTIFLKTPWWWKAGPFEILDSIILIFLSLFHQPCFFSFVLLEGRRRLFPQHANWELTHALWPGLVSTRSFVNNPMLFIELGRSK